MTVENVPGLPVPPPYLGISREVLGHKVYMALKEYTPGYINRFDRSTMRAHLADMMESLADDQIADLNYLYDEGEYADVAGTFMKMMQEMRVLKDQIDSIAA